MFNINKVKTVYLACGVTDLRKSIDGLVMIVQNEMKLDPFDNVLFVFCNKQMNKLKILHFDEGFWLYYYRLEHSHFKWPQNPEEALKVNKEELNRLGLDAPKDWDDLIKPEYKGLVGLSNPSTAGTAKLIINTMIQMLS